jgi:hypothetical protein
MLDLALLVFGTLVTSCVGIFVVVTRSEFKKMNAHPERYQDSLKDQTT